MGSSIQAAWLKVFVFSFTSTVWKASALRHRPFLIVQAHQQVRGAQTGLVRHGQGKAFDRACIRVARVQLDAQHGIEPLRGLGRNGIGRGDHRVAHAAVATQVAIHCEVGHPQLESPALGGHQSQLGDPLQDGGVPLAHRITEGHAREMGALHGRHRGVVRCVQFTDRPGRAHARITAALGLCRTRQE